jgi:hypothetical protein
MAHDGGKADKDRNGNEGPVHRQVEHGSAPKVSPKAFSTIELQKPGRNLARSALSDEVSEFWQVFCEHYQNSSLNPVNPGLWSAHERMG